MLGGGVFITQNKVLPGSYVNVVNASATGSTVSDRGTVAIALPLGKSVGEVIKITAKEFDTNCSTILGKTRDSADMLALREIFCHANKVYVYDLGDDKTVADAVAALEAYDFNILCAYTDVSADVTAYITAVKAWRDELGKKCQVVVYNQTNPDHEGVINVVSTVSDGGVSAFALVAWTAGAEAGCKINESCTNMLYDGECTIVANKTQEQLEGCLENGQLVFHRVYDEIRILEDINSLKTTTVDKGDDFKANQTIRVVDQIANDMARLFNTKYLGKIANNETGRISLWGEIVKHHRELEAVGAIEKFDSSLLTVTQGNTKKSVVVNDVVTVTNAMAQLYMTVVIQ